MAMVSRSERFNWERPKSGSRQEESIGPGSYVIPSSFSEETVRPSYAPFNSTSQLDDSQGSPKQKKAPEPWPDPGTYDPKLPRAYDAGLPKKHVPFTSGAPRLSVASSKDTAPGPGQYNVAKIKLELAACKTMGAPQAEQKIMFKSTSAPSIPCGHQCYGYDEAGDGRLLRQPRKDGIKELSGRPDESAGPGQYNTQQFLAIGSKPTTFGRIMPPPENKNPKEVETPGPGHYLAKGAFTEKPVYSSFVSQTERGTKAEKMAAEMPGPGQYSSLRSSKPSLRELHPELQFFGSTSERFKEAIAGQGPGPGYYGDPSSRRKEQLRGAFSQARRFQETAVPGKEAPGPGQYDPIGTDGKTTGQTGTVSILGSTGSLAFGSMESRHGPSRKADGPGPGAYYSYLEEESTLSDSALPSASRRRAPQRYKPPSSMFQSNVPKDAMTRQYEKEGQLAPPPGAYTPIYAKDVGTIMRLAPKGEGFGSAAPRIMNDVKAYTAPGPGRYEPGEVTCGKVAGTFNRIAVEGAPATGRVKGLGFESGVKRFASKGENAKAAPGPGTYSIGTSLISTTHNVHFGALL